MFSIFYKQIKVSRGRFLVLIRAYTFTYADCYAALIFTDGAFNFTWWNCIDMCFSFDVVSHALIKIDCRYWMDEYLTLISLRLFAECFFWKRKWTAGFCLNEGGNVLVFFWAVIFLCRFLMCLIYSYDGSWKKSFLYRLMLITLIQEAK